MTPPGYDSDRESDDVTNPREVQTELRTGKPYILEDGEKVWCVEADPEDDVDEEELLYDRFGIAYRRVMQDCD